MILEVELEKEFEIIWLNFNSLYDINSVIKNENWEITGKWRLINKE